MLLKTRHFGDVEIDESKLIAFDEGIPGFENAKKFYIIENTDQTSPFKWLQSVDQPELAFAIVNPFLIKKDYDIEVNDTVAESLGVEAVEDVAVYSIVVVPEDISKISMNLKAPVIINTRNNRGVQVILDTDKYSVRHYILEELRRQEVEADAGTDKEKGTVHCNK